MSDVTGQQELFPESSPSALWNQAATKRALDELFTLAGRYRSGPDFHALLAFVARFRFYSPFNAMLIHIQKPGAKYAATASRWWRDYGRQIRAGAQPIAILQPRGPVMFVFDVSDTVPVENAPSLPTEVTDPFEVRGGKVGGVLEHTMEVAKRDGVQVVEEKLGSQAAGWVRVAKRTGSVTYEIPRRSAAEVHQVPLRYELLVNGSHSREARYATLAHELGHLYCGHIGTPNPQWWPDRRGLSKVETEFEAESICYLLCGRLGIDNPSEEYLAGYLAEGSQVPAISLDCLMKAAGLIEQMGRERLPARKSKE
jgi:hypothetical protein